MKKLLLLSLLCMCSAGLLAQTYTVSGNVYNDPNGGVVDASAVPYSLPLDPLSVVLVESGTDIVSRVVNVNYTTGVFVIPFVSAGTYYMLLSTSHIEFPIGETVPGTYLETSWTYTGESILASGAPDATIDGKTDPIVVSSAHITGVKFGIQKRPSAHNKMNQEIDNTSISPIPLMVNAGSLFTQGGSAILSGSDYSGGSIVNYSIRALPRHGTLYLGSVPVSSIDEVDTLSSAEFSTLAYLPNASALTQELDIFNYAVIDNAFSQSNNSNYVIPFQLLDGDGDTYSNRVDQDDDNDGLTDLEECELNDISALTTAYFDGEFIYIKPHMFGYTIGDRIGIDTTVDVSQYFGYPTNSGAIIVTVTNANTHPSADEFYVNDLTGPTQWSIYGTVGTYAMLEHGMQYFSYDTRSLTIFNSTPNRIVLSHTGIDPVDDNWLSDTDNFTWWLTSDTASRTATIGDSTYSDPRLGQLTIALIAPEPKYFQFASTANNISEWSTYFVSVLPECDDDMDGVPNRLDLDSDNDGCLDALEGSALLEYTDVEAAGGTVWVGTGSTADNFNICADVACVDADGIPLLTSGGQSAIGTYDELIQSDICATVTPVTLFEFIAEKSHESVLLRWATGSEQNCLGFDIERSEDGQDWRQIGYVPTQAVLGNSHTQLIYTFIDDNPVEGNNLYRLKQMDRDGRYEYSLIRLVKFDVDEHINIHPNPTSDKIHITGLQKGVVISVYDISGRIVHQTTADNPHVNISLNQFSEGLYHIRIMKADGQVTVHKIIKTK